MFPYLEAQEIGKVMVLNKQMHRLANNWVVWKNVLFEQYMKPGPRTDIYALLNNSQSKTYQELFNECLRSAKLVQNCDQIADTNLIPEMTIL